MRCLNCKEAFDGTKKACPICGTEVIEVVPVIPEKIPEVIAEPIKPTKKKTKK